MMERAIITGMTALSALLPLLGLLGLLRTARRDANEVDQAPRAAGGSDAPTLGQFNVLIGQMKRSVINRPRAVLQDLALIGAGIVLAAAASIWSLWIPNLS